MVEMSDRADPAAPVAVPISLWSSMHNVDTVELSSSTAPTKDDAMKMKIAERVEESGVEVAITFASVSVL